MARRAGLTMNERTFEALLVEDNPDHAYLISRTLREACDRVAVNVVEDGERAIHYIKNLGPYRDRPAPDLILLDIRLPKRDGLEVLAELKRSPNYRSIPVILITGSSREVDMLAGYDLGANSYIVKPEAPSDLVEKLKTIAAYWLCANDLPRD